MGLCQRMLLAFGVIVVTSALSPLTSSAQNCEIIKIPNGIIKCAQPGAKCDGGTGRCVTLNDNECDCLIPGAPLPTYTCGDPSSGHCYGVNAWTQGTEYFGAYADITQVQMSCPSGCGGFVDDEIWLIDRSSTNCTSNDFQMCWVEAGTFATEGNNPQYFWADSRPGTGNTFNLHYLGNTDPVGTVDHYMIIKDGRATPNTYLVFIYNDLQSTLYSETSSVAGTGGCGSPLPQMVGREIDIGQELAGTPPASSVASASTAHFTRNTWAIKPLDSSYVFVSNAQTAQGAVTNAKPPTAAWAQNPGAPGAPVGGDFTTLCC